MSLPFKPSLWDLRHRIERNGKHYLDIRKDGGMTREVPMELAHEAIQMRQALAILRNELARMDQGCQMSPELQRYPYLLKDVTRLLFIAKQGLDGVPE